MKNNSVLPSESKINANTGYVAFLWNPIVEGWNCRVEKFSTEWIVTRTMKKQKAAIET